jgi:hypothetical protein
MEKLTLFVDFADVARHERFSKAVRELGLAFSSLAERVAWLFNRTTRSVTRTDEGGGLYRESQWRLGCRRASCTDPQFAELCAAYAGLLVLEQGLWAANS